ncbi:aromatic ring-hydroxylating oxygenase subunit alpha [Mycolicibacterium elephantis]|uniref:Ring hydroxylating dioxygenase n=1 Tax=Mycolicibacterium elephantis DSM 44368 TaxID=1335622 RepID=A0A439DQF6_9MYCO|nr:SRPBCC family protein [Mycolicibacterium elephantis]MCV7219492.1 Rieske 2Fe-2S domain-containing protein [Mycolicibacterium elephantis]RWA17930.1 ring hydroxylating dioxygenase [Mycolicibacterium elephantis DSM 44368]
MTTSLPRQDRIRRALELLRNETTDKFDEVVRFSADEFTDPVLAQAERDLIFGVVPSIVAHGSEIAKPYDFLTVAMPRNNIIVVRQKDGGIKAFVNLCRHRGALLEENEKGRCRFFSCPYHRWSYDPDGSLRMITRDATFGEVDREKHGLVEVPCEERHGFIWVVDNAHADIDVAAWLGPEMDAILAGYRLDTLICVRSAGFEEPTNWKIMQDAFLDGYHIQYAHPNTAGKVIHTNVMAFEDFGRHCRFIAPRKSIDRWLEEDPGDRDLGAYVTETHFLLPNSTLLRQPDHFQLLTFRPDQNDPTRSRMEQRLIVPTLEASGLEEEHWNKRWDKNWQILLAVLHDEDFPLLRNAQRGMTSADAGEMLLGRNETANQVFRRETRKLLAAGAASSPR